MRWKQFFTPVKSLNAQESRELMDGLDSSEFNLIDVRQPGEYEAGHLPGARLIPMAELDQRLGELDRDKPTLVY
jgi:rhodanese-related sulfurtransferase